MKKYKFIGSCDRFRKSTCGEAEWQEMMKNKRAVSEKNFLKLVNIKELLDKDEKWSDYKNTLIKEGENPKFFISGKYAFFQHSGFEFIWQKQ